MALAKALSKPQSKWQSESKGAWLYQKQKYTVDITLNIYLELRHPHQLLKELRHPSKVAFLLHSPVTPPSHTMESCGMFRARLLSKARGLQIKQLYIFASSLSINMPLWQLGKQQQWVLFPNNKIVLWIKELIPIDPDISLWNSMASHQLAPTPQYMSFWDYFILNSTFSPIISFHPSPLFSWETVPNYYEA